MWTTSCLPFRLHQRCTCSGSERLNSWIHEWWPYIHFHCKRMCESVQWICLAGQHQEPCQRSNHHQHHHNHAPQSLPYFALVIPSLKVKVLFAKGLQVPLVRSDTPARHNKDAIHDLWSPTFACDITIIIVPPRRKWYDNGFNISVHAYIWYACIHNTYHIILLYSCPYCWVNKTMPECINGGSNPPFNHQFENDPQPNDSLEPGWLQRPGK